MLKLVKRYLIIMLLILSLIFAGLQTTVRNVRAGVTPYSVCLCDLNMTTGHIQAADDGTLPDYDSAGPGWTRIYFYPRSNEIAGVSQSSMEPSETDVEANFIYEMTGWVDKTGPNGNSYLSMAAWLDCQGFPTEWAPVDSTDDLIAIVDKYVNTTDTGYTASSDMLLSGIEPQEFPPCKLYKIPIPIATNITSMGITLSWNQVGDDNGNVWGYILYKNTQLKGSYVFVDTIQGINNTVYNDTSIVVGKTYYYKLGVLYRGQPCPVGSLYKSAPGGPYIPTDTTPPTIIHMSITSAYTNRSIQINATVTDDTGVKTVSLWYKGVNGTQYNVSMSSIQRDKYYYQIPAQTVPGTLYYSIWASDSYNNTASHPETGNHTVIILSAAGNISGRVIDSITEQGIQDALVIVVQKPEFNTTTNSTGHYIITGVPEGAYTVRAKKTGYEDNTRTNVQVVPGQTTPNVNIALTSLDTAGPTILNTVPEDNTVITTATPRIYANYTRINVNSVILLIDGINVTVNATITEANITYIPSDAFSDGIHNVSLEVRDAKGNLRYAVWVFIISTKGTVSGVVKDANDNPIESVTITILGTGSSATTNTEGHYTIANISTGTYDIKAEKAGYESETKSISISGGDFKARDFSLDKVQQESPTRLIPSASSFGTIVALISTVFIIGLWRRRK